MRADTQLNPVPPDLKLLLPAALGFVCLLSVTGCGTVPSSNPDLGFEVMGREGKPAGWYVGPSSGVGTGYLGILDSETVYAGKYSLRLESRDVGSSSDYGVGRASVDPSFFRGENVRVDGYLKTVNVHGAARIALLVDAEPVSLIADDLQDTVLWGTHGWTRFSADIRVPDTAWRFQIELSLSGTGVAWFDNLRLAMTDGDYPYRLWGSTRIAHDRSVPDSLTQEETSWLRAHAFPLEFVDQGGQPKDGGVGADALRPFGDLVGDAHVVSIGEAAHGDREEWLLYTSLVKFLVLDKGFTEVGIELGFANVARLNDYLLTGKDNSDMTLIDSTAGVYRCVEFLDLLHWMRAYNAAGHKPGPLRMTGFDREYGEWLFDSLLSLYRDLGVKAPSNNVDVGKEGLNMLEGIFYNAFHPGSAPSISEEELKRYYDRLVRELGRVADKVRSLRRSSRSQAGKERIERIAHYCDVVIQHFGDLYTSRYHQVQTSYRDSVMAANIRWRLERAPVGSKMIVLVHNGHVGRMTGLVGGALSDMYGAEYRPVCICLHKGIANDHSTADGRRIAIEESYPGTLEWVLHRLQVPAFFLNLTGASRWPPQASWLTSAYGFHDEEGGMIYDRDTTVVVKYDALFYLDSVSPSHLIQTEPATGQ